MHQVRMSVGIMMTVLMLLSSSGVHARMQEATPAPEPDTGEVVTTGEEAPVNDDVPTPPDPVETPTPPVEEATGPAPVVTEETPADGVDESNPPTGPPAEENPVSDPLPTGEPVIGEPAPGDGPVVNEPVASEEASAEEPILEESATETPVIDDGEPDPVNETEAPSITAALTSVEEDTPAGAIDDTGMTTTQVEETLTVTVLDSEGNPVANAYVTVRNDDWMLSGEGVTNANGVVVLSNLGGGAAYHVEATALNGARGGGSVSRLDGTLDLTITIRMHQDDDTNSSVTIEALEFQSGEFIRGATYSVYDASGTLLHTITAGPDERSIEVEGLAEGFYTVMVTAAGYQPGYGQFFMPQTSEVTVLIRERSSFLFNLTVSEAGNGAPVAGASVTIHGGNGDLMASGETDASGMFSRDLLDKGYAYEEYVVTVTHASYLPGSQVFTVDDPAQPVNMGIALDPVPPVVISVIDGDTNSVPDATVTVFPAGGGDAVSGTTDADGTFPITGLVDGDYTVTVTKDGYETENVTFTYPTNGPVVIQLVEETGTGAANVTIFVHDARTGEPIEGATLIAVDLQQGFVTQGVTGPDGSWTTRNNGIARTVLISAPGYRDGVTGFPPPESGIESRSVALYQLVTGVLVDDVTGEPIANAEITLWEPRSPHTRYVTTTEDGSFSFFFNPYPHGEVIRFRARLAPAYETATFHITMNSAVPLIELRLSPRAQEDDEPGNAVSQGTLTTSFTLCANADCAAPHDTSLDGSTVTWTVTEQAGSAFVLPGTIALASAGSGGTGTTLQAQATDQHTITAVLEDGVATGSLDLPVGGYTVCLQSNLTGADGSTIPLAGEESCDTVRLTEDGIIGGPLAFGAVADSGDITQPNLPGQDGSTDTDDPATDADGEIAGNTDDADPDAADDAATAGSSVNVSGLPSAGSGQEAASTSAWWMIASAAVLLLSAIGLRQRSRI